MSAPWLRNPTLMLYYVNIQNQILNGQTLTYTAQNHKLAQLQNMALEYYR